MDFQEPVVKERIYRFDQVGSRLHTKAGQVKGVATTIWQVEPKLKKIVMPLWEKLGMEGLGIVALLTILIWLFFYFRYRYKKDEISAEPANTRPT